MTEGFSQQAEQFLKDARLPENVQAIAQQGVAKTQEFYTKSAATAQESAKVLTEVAETLGEARKCSTRSWPRI